MDLNKFGRRAYKCALLRGKISDTFGDRVKAKKEMIDGVGEEFDELKRASELSVSDHLPEYSEVCEELADIVIASITELTRRGVDVEEIMHKKMKYNELRD